MGIYIFVFIFCILLIIHWIKNKIKLWYK